MDEQVKKQLDLINKISQKVEKKLTLNQKELAQALGVSASTIEAKRKEGTGVEWIHFGDRILYSKLKVAEFLANSNIKTA